MLRGSYAPTRPDPNQVLEGSIPDALTATSPGDTAVMVLDPANCRAPLLAYIIKEVLPPERTEARQVTRRAKTFVAIGDKLYKQSLSGILKKCIPTDQRK